MITGKPFGAQAYVFVRLGAHRIGLTHLKALFRRYTDRSFRHLEARLIEKSGAPERVLVDDVEGQRAHRTNGRAGGWPDRPPASYGASSSIAPYGPRPQSTAAPQRAARSIVSGSIMPAPSPYASAAANESPQP